MKRRVARPLLRNANSASTPRQHRAKPKRFDEPRALETSTSAALRRMTLDTARALDRARPVKMQRPGGRTEAIRKAVVSTVLDLLKAGHLDFTFLQVADLSGVGRRTLHRRWPNRLALLREALAEHHNMLNVQFGSSFEDDLYGLALALRDFLMDPKEIALNRVLASTKNVEFRRELLAQFESRVTRPALERFHTAQQAGEINTEVDADVAWLMLGSSIFTLCFVTGEPPNGQQLHRLVSAVMRICRA